MTIPTVITSTKEKVTVVKLKKVHSTFENALRLAVLENGTPDNWKLSYDGENGSGAVKFFNTLAPNLNIIKNCENGKGCFPDANYDYAFGGNVKNFGKILLADGTSVACWIQSGNCTTKYGNTKALQNGCGVLVIDINGFEKPNKTGKDAFWFVVSKYGIIPAGTSEATVDPFDTTCLAGSLRGCAAWVIYNENMDYLHCKNLSWNGKKSCK